MIDEDFLKIEKDNFRKQIWNDALKEVKKLNIWNINASQICINKKEFDKLYIEDKK